MKKKFTQEYSEYGKTLPEWLKSWTDLKFRPDTDNMDEYIQKFKELAGLLVYLEDHQVQIFKMMMPENIELRIKDMTTLDECIDEAKACLTICQPSSLVSRMTTLTLGQSDVSPPRSPLKYYLLVSGKRDKHMVEHKHFNQQRAIQYYADIRNTLSSLFRNNNTKIKQCSIQ